MKLLYFSPVNWNSYYQRPHYMAQYFLNKNNHNKIIWVNPYPNRFPNITDLINPRPRSTKPTPLLNNLQIISPKALPIEPVPYSEIINFNLFWQKFWPELKDITHIGIGRPSKLAIMALNKLNYKSSFYDAMDDFPEFYKGLSRLSMRAVEHKIIQKTHKTFVSSTALAQKIPTAFKILNGYTMQTLPEANPVSSGILGYVGTIGQWFDWGIILKLAQLFPQNIIRLIGPCFIPGPEKLPNNIELLPECSQPEAIEQIKKFHIGLIPFKKTALTHGVDPIKYYEYKAMGLPILSTQFGEMAERLQEPGVFFIDNHNLAENTQKALNFKYSPENISDFRRQNDWQSRFNLLGID